MSPTNRAKLVSYLSIAIGCVAIWAAGVKPELGVFRALLGVPGLAILGFGVYDRWLWRLGPYGAPVLLGTWRGELLSTWKDASGQSVGPIPVFIVVRQMATAISITLLSKESRSWSVTGAMNRARDGQYEITWAYRNEPLASLAQRSGMHYGAAIIAGVSRRHPERLQGKYWTDRNTNGDLRLTNHSEELVDSFLEAEALFVNVPAVP